MPVMTMMMVAVAICGEAVAQFAHRLVLVAVAVEAIEDRVSGRATDIATRRLLARIEGASHAARAA